MLCRINISAGTCAILFSKDGGTNIYARVNFAHQHAYSGVLGWRIFQFASNISWSSGTELWRIGIQATSSNENNVAFGYSSSGPETNFAQMFRLVSVTPTILTGQFYYILGETRSSTTVGSALSVQRLITLDETLATRVYAGLHIGKGGILQGSNVANQTYRLYFQPNCQNVVAQGGMLSLFTLSSALTLSSRIEFVGDGRWTFEPGHTVIAYGASMWPTWSALVTDAPTGTTVLTIGQQVSWASGSSLVLAATQVVTSSYERLTLAATVSSGQTLGLTAGLSQLCWGSTPIQAHVANLSRNIRFCGSLATAGLELRVQSGLNLASRFDVQAVQFGPNLGPTTGLQVSISSGAFIQIRNCSLFDGVGTNSVGLQVSSDATVVESNTLRGSCTLQSLVSANFAGPHVWLGPGSDGGPVQGARYNNSIAIYNRGQLQNLIYSYPGRFSQTSGLVLADGYGPGLVLALEPGQTATGSSISSHLIYSCNSWGLLLTAGRYPVLANSVLTQLGLSGLTVWGTAGVNWSYPYAMQFTVERWALFGNNQGAGSNLTWNGYLADVTFSSLCTFDGGPSPGPQASYLLYAGKLAAGELVFDSCTFEPWQSVKRAVLGLPVGGAPFQQVYFQTCRASSSWVDPVNEQGRLVQIRARQLEQPVVVDGSTVQQRYLRFGTLGRDTGIARPGRPASERMEPGWRTAYLESSPKWLAVPAGNDCRVEVWVRASTLADGASYSNEPVQLVLKRRAGSSPSEDTILAQRTVVPGVWSRLVGQFNAPVTGVYTVVVRARADSDGAGWLNVGDWQAGWPSP